MTKLTIQDVTNLYLYKEELLPRNRLDDSLISKTLSRNRKIDKKEFMLDVGRFVTANDFDIVRYFFYCKRFIN